MPAGFGELDSLQHLDEFKVDGGLDRGQWSKLGELFGLNLRGQLQITFGDEATEDDWDGVEGWKPLVHLQVVFIDYYKGMRIPLWANGGAGNPSQPLLPNLTRLSLSHCHRVKSLPPLRHLLNLKYLLLYFMLELEYIEEEEEREKNENTQVAAASDASFLPYFETLWLWRLPKLKGWSRKVEEAMTANGEEQSSSTTASALTTPLPQLFSFPRLSTLQICNCEELKYMPQCPTLAVMTLHNVDAKLLSQLLSIHDNQDSCPSTTTSSPSSLKSVLISSVNGLTSFPGRTLTSLRYLSIQNCDELKDVELAPSHLNILEELTLYGFCPELNMWEESDKRGVDWDSLPNLRKLSVPEIPSPERLPNCLRNLQSLGKLQIEKSYYWSVLD